jgi:hypothetical protein
MYEILLIMKNEWEVKNGLLKLFHNVYCDAETEKDEDV